MRPSFRQNALLTTWLALSLAGCGSNQVSTGGTGTGGGGGYTPPTGSFVGLGFTGKVMAGASPVSGAAVEMFAAGTAGNGSAPTQLFATALTTDTTGGFNVAPGTYTCPLGTSILFIVAAGGHVGNGAANAGTELVTVPGACNSLGTGSSFVVNEVTTAATAYALRPFLAPGAQLGSTATNTAGLSLAVGTLGNLVNLSTGTAPGAGFPANGTAPTAKLNTIANILHGCAGGSTSAGCSSLFGAVTVAGIEPSNTLDAALALANHPGTNILTLSTAGPVFSPALTAYPADWTLAIPFTGGGLSGPASVSVDSKGNVWAVNYFGAASLFSNTGVPAFAKGITGYGLQESYGGAVDGTDRMWVANEEDADYSINNGFGSVTVLDSAGPALPGNSLYSSGGLSFPIAIGFDRNSTAWIVDYGNSHVTLMNSSGVPQSGANGYTSDQFAFPDAVAVDSKGYGWVGNQSAGTVTKVAADGSSFVSYTVGSAPAAVAVDSADNVWTANFYGDSAGLVSAGGKVMSGGGFTGGGLDRPTGIALDGAGTAWIANYRAPGITELAGAEAANPGDAVSGSAGWGADLKLLEAFGVAVDAAGNVWVSSYGDNRLIEFVGVATPVRTPLLGGVRIP